ncbi:hypothetical protein Tco_0573090 [Tanacetum coccineum]
MSMTIQSSVKDKILATSSETSKVENTPAEMLRDLDQQMEKRADDGTWYIRERIRRTITLETCIGSYTDQVSSFSSYTRRFQDVKLEKICIDEIIASNGILVMINEMDDLPREFGRYNEDTCYRFGSSYHLSIRCAPFEALYGRKCRSLVLWAEIIESSLTGLELVQETTDKVVLVKEKPKAARDRQNSYVNYRHKLLEFEVGDRVLLKVTPWKGVVRFGKKGKLAPRYVGP